MVALLICTAARAEAPEPPVLFVHGYKGSPADFDVLKDALVRAGYQPERMQSLALPDSWGSSNVENAATIERAARELSEKWDRRVVIIAHSMGGLAARYSVKFLETSRYVDTVVTLGTMNGGLPPGGFSSPCSAPFGIVRYFEELCSEGALIAQLNSGRAVPSGLQYINIYSGADEIVPAQSAFLRGAENIELQGVTHSGPTGYLESPSVLRLLIARLQQAHPLRG